MKKVLSDETREELLMRFKKLKTLEERLAFWQKELPINYIAYWELGTERNDLFNELKEFDFEIEQAEREKFAQWVIDNYHNLSTGRNKYKNLLTRELLIKDFETKLRDVPAEDKDTFISEELDRIENSFELHIPLNGRAFLQSKTDYQNKEYNADYKTFAAYIKRNLYPKYKNVSYLHHILPIANGLTLGQYYRYLEEKLIKQTEATNVEEDFKDEYNVRIQHQILYFLHEETYTRIKENGTLEQKGALLAALFNRNQQRARKPFSSSGILTSNNKADAKNIRRDLIVVERLFTESNYREEAEKVRIAIHAINQKHFPEDLV